MRLITDGTFSCTSIQADILTNVNIKLAAAEVPRLQWYADHSCELRIAAEANVAPGILHILTEKYKI